MPAKRTYQIHPSLVLATATLLDRAGARRIRFVEGTYQTGPIEPFFQMAGWDLKAAAAGDAVDGDYGVGGFAGLQELRDLNKPVIACVNGMAVGGGFELALSCDLIYASDHSSFALPEIRAGTLADAATIKLPKRILFAETLPRNAMGKVQKNVLRSTYEDLYKKVAS